MSKTQYRMKKTLKTFYSAPNTDVLFVQVDMNYTASGNTTLEDIVENDIYDEDF